MTLAASLVVMVVAAATLGLWAYWPTARAGSSVADRRPEITDQAAGRPPPLADAISIKYKAVLNIATGAPAPAEDAGKKSDPIELVTLAGVVASDGELMAVFVVGDAGGDQKLITVKSGQEVVPAWHVQRLESTSVVLVKGAETRRFSLFE
jgi:hypothetical protein